MEVINYVKKVCFVSGAARGKGNGRAIALRLAEAGADRFDQDHSLHSNGARFGITANAVTLGIVGTDAFYDLPEKARKDITSRVPMKKEGVSQDVASIVDYLASDDVSYITGANVMVTGGLELFTF